MKNLFIGMLFILSISIFGASFSDARYEYVQGHTRIDEDGKMVWVNGYYRWVWDYKD